MTNKIDSLQLEDLNPQSATFTLSSKPNRIFKLKPFSLAQRIWVNKRFGKEEIHRIFNEQDVACMAEIAHHLLEDKSDCPDFMSFAEFILGPVDQIALTKALLQTVGIDDALIKSLSAKLNGEDPNAKAADPQP